MKQKNRIIQIFILVASLCLLTACSPFLEINRENWRDKMLTHNQAGYDLIESEKYEEAITELNIAVDYVYKLAPDVVDLDHELKATSSVDDAPFNNLSWAYYSIEDYEKGLEYIEKSLLILPNTDAEYVNKGNALYGLGRSDEALVNYDLAIKSNKDGKSAYYGKGLIFYDRGDYQEAIKELDTYLNRDKTDMDAIEMKIKSHINLGENQKALTYIDAFVQGNPYNYEACKLKVAALESIGDIKAVKKQFELMKFRFPHNIELYVQMIETYSAMEELDLAKLSYAEGVKKDKSNMDLYSTMGNIYMNKNDYVAAADYFDQALKLNPQDESANSNKLKALFNGKRNLQCVALSQKAAKIKAVSSDIAWFTGQCELELAEYKAAIENFERVIKLDPDDAEAYANIAYAYLLLENNDKAEEYSLKSLDLDDYSSRAQYVKDTVLEKRKPLGQQISKFFSDYYLYKDDKSDLDKILSRLDKADLSAEEMAEVIDEARMQEDPFTGMIYGDQYDKMTAGRKNDITYEDQGNIAYFRINNFSRNTDDKFIEQLDKITDSEKKLLVIDLRGDTGGDTQSSNNILDALLPDRVTSTLIYKDGYTENYYSDASHIDFKKVYLFVDERSASASELLTLSLKTYLNNVTVVGRDTFGKGVGQQVFEDKKNKVLVLVVNHYWNVRQTNIMNSHIKPDIYVSGDELTNYMKWVKE